MSLTRRHLLAGAATAGVAAAVNPIVSTPGHASVPIAGKQAPGFYRIKVGDIEVTMIHDGAPTFPLPENFVRNVSRDETIAAIEAAYLAPKGQVSIPLNPTLVNTGSKLVLIDTGYGPARAPAAGQAIANLTAAGVDPKSVDVVVISHMHPDHTNGLLTADGALAFPNAELKVPAADWAFWMDDGNMSQAKDALTKGYFENNRKVFSNLAGKVTKYDWGKEVAPGITAIDAKGHTPGHTAFAVASGSARILVQCDVTNIPQLFLQNPDWQVVFDHDPVQAAATRHKIYDMAATERMLISGFHFPFPAAGYVEKDGPHYRLIPVTWRAAL